MQIWIPEGMLFDIPRLNWNASKGNQAPIQKFERPNRKIPESELFFDLGQELVPPAHLKAQ